MPNTFGVALGLVAGAAAVSADGLGSLGPVCVDGAGSLGRGKAFFAVGVGSDCAAASFFPSAGGTLNVVVRITPPGGVISVVADA